jgi:hypothetical protein
MFWLLKLSYIISADLLIQAMKKMRGKKENLVKLNEALHREQELEKRPTYT